MGIVVLHNVIALIVDRKGADNYYIKPGRTAKPQGHSTFLGDYRGELRQGCTRENSNQGFRQKAEFGTSLQLKPPVVELITDKVHSQSNLTTVLV